MEDFLKELFKGGGEKLRTPQVPGVIAIILLIFRVTFSVEFLKLRMIFVNGLGNFVFLINVIHLVSIMLFITSVIAFIAGVFFTITYLTMDIIADKKKNLSRWLQNSYSTIHRFFLGSKIAIINVNMWLLVALSYFYMFDEATFYRYKSVIIDFIIQANILIQGLSVLYTIVLFVSFLKFVERILYKFLYFKLDEKTEKIIYEARE